MQSFKNEKNGSFKVKFTVLLGYALVVGMMAFSLFALYGDMVNYFDKRIKLDNMSELLIVGNTVSLLYGIECQQNMINTQNAEQYLHKFDSIAGKIKFNLDAMKRAAADSSRIDKLDVIQNLVCRKRENLLKIAASFDSIRQPIKILTTNESSHVLLKLNRDITDYLETKNMKNTILTYSDTSVLVGERRGLLDRLRDVFVVRLDSTYVIEKMSIFPKNDIKLIIDTVINKVRYAERLDLERQKRHETVYHQRCEEMAQTNRMLTNRINELLKEIEREEIENSVQLISNEEDAIENSRKTMFFTICMALFFSFACAILFLIDINKSHRYRKQLEMSNKRIFDLLTERGKLMLTISHDIKAPINSILGFIELMNTHGDQKNEFYLNNMKCSSEHILQLASALLDYHKLNEGNWQLNESNFNVHKLIENTALSFEPLANQKGLAFTFENLLPETLAAYGDLYMIREIINNIISNAIKYTREGAVHVKALLKNDGSAKRLVLTVTDTGEGIDAADQQIIFQEYIQLNSLTGENVHTDGSGLGLPIAKGFVDALKGSITLNSRKGEGSEFIVEIPLQDVRKEEEQSAVKPEAVRRSMESVSVLIVDDDPVQLTMTSEMLAKKKIKCTTELNTEKVLPLLQSRSFDILFLDIQMPYTDGIALVENIRSLDSEKMKNLPIIGLSARSDITMEEMKNAGFTDFLTKPFNSNGLYDMIYQYTKAENPVEEHTVQVEKQTSDSRGVAALVELVGDDRETSGIILQTFIDETSKSRKKLKKAFHKKDEKSAQTIVHKILPLFRLIGDMSIITLMEKSEKGNRLTAEEESLMLMKIEEVIGEAKKFEKELSKG